MKRPNIRVYVSPQILEAIQDKADSLGLRPPQYVKYIILKDIDPKEAKFSQQDILDKAWPE